MDYYKIHYVNISSIVTRTDDLVLVCRKSETVTLRDAAPSPLPCGHWSKELAGHQFCTSLMLTHFIVWLSALPQTQTPTTNQSVSLRLQHAWESSRPLKYRFSGPLISPWLVRKGPTILILSKFYWGSAKNFFYWMETKLFMFFSNCNYIFKEILCMCSTLLTYFIRYIFLWLKKLCPWNIYYITLPRPQTG